MLRRMAVPALGLRTPSVRFFGRGPHRGGVRRPPQTLTTPAVAAAADPSPKPVPKSPEDLSKHAKANATPAQPAAAQQPRAEAHGAEIKRLARMAYSSAFCREQIRERCKTAAVEIALKHFDDFATGMATYTNTAEERAAICASGDDLAKLEALLASFEGWYYERTAPRVVDLARPSEWYPRARMMRRKFIFHCGPTNSGKTHAALEALKAAKSGVYCAPLKALAAQVWRRVNSAGVPCDLLIGDERQFAGFADHTSCTVEMTPIEFQVDVGVIDEVQLIEDRDRGAAWTRALLGLPAREVHLCGEERALDVVKQILYESRELKGLEVRRYNRLVPLEVEKSNLDGDFSRLRNGDCLVTFSRKSVFSLAAAIRKAHPHASVRTIYGSLPFAVRERETDAFNDAVAAAPQSGERAILVTTDAIAYGLNLSIRRIIFTATTKYDGRSMVKLSPTTVMQVAGRAGRFGMQFDRGFVTGLRRREHNDIVDVIGSTGNVSKLQPTTPIKRAGLLPTAEILGTFVSLRRRKASAAGAADPKFEDLVAAFATECRVGGVYFACDMERALMPIARLVSRVDMPDDDRIMFCFAPVGVANKDAAALIASWAEMHAKGEPVKLQLDARLDDLLEDASRARDSLLMELEGIYRLAEGYCWLAWRFRRSFVELELGTEVKRRCADAIADRLPN